jgi:hypothetical protein
MEHELGEPTRDDVIDQGDGSFYIRTPPANEATRATRKPVAIVAAVVATLVILGSQEASAQRLLLPGRPMPMLLPAPMAPSPRGWSPGAGAYLNMYRGLGVGAERFGIVPRPSQVPGIWQSPWLWPIRPWPAY